MRDDDDALVASELGAALVALAAHAAPLDAGAYLAGEVPMALDRALADWRERTHPAATTGHLGVRLAFLAELVAGPDRSAAEVFLAARILPWADAALDALEADAVSEVGAPAAQEVEALATRVRTLIGGLADGAGERVGAHLDEALAATGPGSAPPPELDALARWLLDPHSSGGWLTDGHVREALRDAGLAVRGSDRSQLVTGLASAPTEAQHRVLTALGGVVEGWTETWVARGWVRSRHRQVPGHWRAKVERTRHALAESAAALTAQPGVTAGGAPLDGGGLEVLLKVSGSDPATGREALRAAVALLEAHGLAVTVFNPAAG